MQFTVGNFIDNQMILPENGKKAQSEWEEFVEDDTC